MTTGNKWDTEHWEESGFSCAISQIVFKIKSEVTDLEENLEAILECNLPRYRDPLLNQLGHALLSAKIINETLLELGDIIRMEEEQ